MDLLGNLTKLPLGPGHCGKTRGGQGHISTPLPALHSPRKGIPGLDVPLVEGGTGVEVTVEEDVLRLQVAMYHSFGGRRRSAPSRVSQEGHAEAHRTKQWATPSGRGHLVGSETRFFC